MRRLPYYVALVLTLAHLVSCGEFDSFTTDPSARLSFSTDTVRFDTLISTIGSSTKTLYVFNGNDEGLRISSICLQEGSGSHFRVNVDGQFLAGGLGRDFEVRRKDSIVVRVEVTMPESGTTEAVTYTDNLVFNLESGTSQKVALRASALDAYIVHGMEVTEDMTLQTDKPYVIYDSLVVREGATLSLSPGTTLMFHDKCGMEVYGKVLSEGTLDKPVILRGDRTDHMFDYLKYDNTPSRWEGVTIHEGSVGNRFVHTDLHSGCHGIVCLHQDDGETCVEIENSIIHNIGGDAFSTKGCKAVVANTQISNARGRCVSQTGGTTTFVHCTLAQYYPFTADRGEALFLSDEQGEWPIRQAHFLSCVITGYGDDVIMGSITDENAPYLFSHCFLNTVVSDDSERFVSVLYDDSDETPHGSDNFCHFDSYNFVYDFTPLPTSRIAGAADPSLLEQYPTDRLGRMRDEAPDAGCYEFVAKDTEEEGVGG